VAPTPPAGAPEIPAPDDTQRTQRGAMRLGEALAAAGLPASDLARRPPEAENLRDAGDRAKATLDWVKAHPLASALIAAGAGYILGRLAR